MEPMTNRSGALVILAQQGALLRRNLKKPISIESRRIALERMITLEFPHVGAYFAEYSSNLSMTGMFIRTDRIQPPGTKAAFEFSLADGSAMIRGIAEVVWVRARHESPDRPAGLGLRFVSLDKENRQLIRWVVEKRLREGGGSLELDEPPASSQGDAPVAEATSTRTEGGDAETRSIAEAAPIPSWSDGEIKSRLRSYAGTGVVRTAGGRWRWGVLVVLAGSLAGALLFLYQGRASEPTVAGGEAAPVIPVPGEEVPVTTHRASPSRRPANSGSEIESPREIIDTVVAWAEAWSMQSVDAYLSFYAESYRPAGDMSLDRWREMRRDRVAGPRRIEVGITDLEVKLLSAERARARFLQAYASDHYRDNTRKILDLVLEDGRWKIQEERSEG